MSFCNIDDSWWNVSIQSAPCCFSVSMPDTNAQTKAQSLPNIDSWVILQGLWPHTHFVWRQIIAINENTSRPHISVGPLQALFMVQSDWTRPHNRHDSLENKTENVRLVSLQRW